MISNLDRLKIELNMNKAVKPMQKKVIIAWMNRAYELGLKEAGRIIEERLGQELEHDALNVLDEANNGKK